AWSAAVDQRPAAVALPRTVSEVSRVVRTAASVGLHVAPQSTGHNAAPLAAQGLERTVLLRTSTMRAVTVDPERRIARIEGGALWQDVVDAAAPHGLAALHGSAPDVGVAGYSLGGGIGWYARRLGMATNSITAAEIVTADGALVRADRRNHPDLFWAVRGGGGSFGVVVAIEMRLYEIEDAYAGMLVWDVSEAERVLTTWADWAVGAPDAVTTSFRMLNVPPLPDVPEPLRGRSIVVIDGAVLGTDEEGERILARLRALGPEIDTFGRVPAPSLTRLHMDPEGPTPFTGETTMLRELTPEAIAAFLATVPTGPGAPLLFAELRQLGGALGRRAEGAGVLPRLDGAFLGFAGGMALTPQMGAAAHAAAEGVVAALAPWSSGSTYLNFAETSADVRSAYPGWSWLQLKGIRSAYDPTGVFVANHRIPRLWEAGRPTA
ncbi:FAD-binding oxidoreductase, partial [Nostocoides japonicum]|uniref:FAD-binding oxidoreductase n=1 Tax=Nostocoides japonicum TaxID=99481 RepID=UPI00065BAC90